MTNRRADVVVIGGGLAGLLCAVTLETRGFEVELLESSDGVGGRVRTDVIDGFRCDRGFQLINPAYPAVRRFVDVRALKLRRFDAGVAVAGARGLTVVADPVRAPQLLGRTLRSGYLRPLQLLRLARWAAPAVRSVPRLVNSADAELFASLEMARVDGRIRREILEPFLAGVLADADGHTSAIFVRLLLRSFLLGTPGVPAAGMVALPEQLAGRLACRPRFGVPALDVRDTADGPVVRTPGGDVRGRAVVVATDPATAGRFLPVTVPRMKGLRTYWFSAAEPPTSLRLLVLDSGYRAAGPVVNTAVMSNIAPEYAPAGCHLVQATTLLPDGSGPSAGSTEREVREHLSRMYGVPATEWGLITRSDIDAAIPDQPVPLDHRRPVTLGNGLFVAGDHRDTASIQGAVVSGRRAANAVGAYLTGA